MIWVLFTCTCIDSLGLLQVFSLKVNYSLVAVVTIVLFKPDTCTGNNLTGIAVQFATQDQKNATPVQKCMAIFNIKICYYTVLFIPISSRLELFAMQNFESELFSVHAFS